MRQSESDREKETEKEKESERVIDVVWILANNKALKMYARIHKISARQHERMARKQKQCPIPGLGAGENDDQQQAMSISDKQPDYMQTR